MQLKATYKIFKIKTCCVVSGCRGEKCSNTLCRGVVHLQSRKCCARAKFLTNQQTKCAVAWLMNAARLVSGSFCNKKCFTFGRAGCPPNKLKIMFEFIELLIAYVAVAKSGLSDRRWISTPVVLFEKKLLCCDEKANKPTKGALISPFNTLSEPFLGANKRWNASFVDAIESKAWKNTSAIIYHRQSSAPVKEGRINGKIESLNVIDFLSSSVSWLSCSQRNLFPRTKRRRHCR